MTPSWAAKVAAQRLLKRRRSTLLKTAQNRHFSDAVKNGHKQTSEVSLRPSLTKSAQDRLTTLCGS
jgi:hypothetical protein